MLINKFSKLLVVLLASVSISSCSQDSAESQIAESINLLVSSTVVVSPADRKESTTCVEGGVSGPQVRLWVSIKWPGVGDANDKLIPLAIFLKFDKGTKLSADYSSQLGAIGETESISTLFGVSDDFLSPSVDYHSSSVCFADYGNLPKPKTELTGNQQIIVPATVQLMGVLRRGNSEVPFVKEAKTKIVYVVGSVGL